MFGGGRLALACGLAAAWLAAGAACRPSVPTAWVWRGGAGTLSAPLVTATGIAVGDARGVALLDLDGRLRCHFDADGSVVAAPRTDGHLLLFGSTNHLVYAIDSSCHEVWSVATGGPIHAPVTVGDELAYVGSLDGHLYALEAATGALRWSFPALPVTAVALPPEPPPAASHPRHGRARPHRGRPAEHARRAARAHEHSRSARLRRAAAATETLSSLPLPLPVETAAPAAATAGEAAAAVGGFSLAAPLLAGEVLFAASTDGALYALDAAHGTLLWRFATEGPLQGTPVADAEHVYFGSSDGNIYAVSLRTHGLAWKVPTQDAVQGAARLSERLLYIGGHDRTAYAIDTGRGQVRWKFPLAAPLRAAPQIFGGLVLLSGDDGVAFVRRADQGLLLKFRAPPRAAAGEATLAGQRLYVPADDGSLTCLELAKLTV